MHLPDCTVTQVDVHCQLFLAGLTSQIGNGVYFEFLLFIIIKLYVFEISRLSVIQTLSVSVYQATKKVLKQQVLLPTLRD